MDTFCKKKVLIILIAVFAGQFTLFSQQKTLIGRVINETSQQPVKFAHIENYSRHITTFADTSGLFSLAANQGDTLVLSAIGFYYKMAVVTDSMLNPSFIPLFELSERIYDIAEANIYIPGTYQKFKQDFIDIDLPETETLALRKTLASIAQIEGKKAYDKAMAERKLDGIRIITIPIQSRW